jgi:hypothetical protein
VPSKDWNLILGKTAQGCPYLRKMLHSADTENHISYVLAATSEKSVMESGMRAIGWVGCALH